MRDADRLDDDDDGSGEHHVDGVDDDTNRRRRQCRSERSDTLNRTHHSNLGSTKQQLGFLEEATARLSN